ncbi:hypothetical protein [Tahibacter caeni]|uniref:hypothetical protein n=1 Tax=Tahibacter caeni TaxID=1453545 RepID=UPI0021487DB5|nr:hypothetical protein [Tahibacter caeni]
MRIAAVRPSSSRPVRRALLLLALAALTVADATGQTVLRGQVIVSGGGRSVSPGGCRALQGAIAEPVVGHASGGSYALSAGFWAGAGGTARDAIFNSGFEGCN